MHYEKAVNMAFYDKSDLKYEYTWSLYKENDIRKNSQSDCCPLNPEEGFEVLYFINSFAEKHKFVNKISGIIIERLIKNHLPKNINCQEKAREWLESIR